MTLLWYGVEGYRCFRAATDLHLRPLTILLGKNNSGKSALARVPLLIGPSIGAATRAPIDLDSSGYDSTATFPDLLYGRRPHAALSISFSLTDGKQSAEVAVRVQNIDEFQMQVVSDLSIHSENMDLRLRWDQGDPRYDRLNYIAEGAGAAVPDAMCQLGFKGLLPTPAAEYAALSDSMWELINWIRRSVDEIRYLGPFRDRPQRLYRTPSGMPEIVGPVGSDAPGILASDFIRGSGLMVDRVNSHLFPEDSPWELRLDPAANHFTLNLVSRADPTVVVNFADTGVGLSQLLPILVQAARDSISASSTPSLNIVEQPELHLHPAAHAALADLYIAGVRTTDSRFLIETHSENLILRIRRHIAEGMLEPDLVALYFVDHDGIEASLKPVPIDRRGRVSNWPRGVFSEDVEEIRAINVARAEQSASE